MTQPATAVGFEESLVVLVVLVAGEGAGATVLVGFKEEEEPVHPDTLLRVSHVLKNILVVQAEGGMYTVPVPVNTEVA